MSVRAEPTRDPRGGVVPGGSPAALEPSLLPLRLSVDRGALSIELTRPHVLPGLVVEALDVLLDGAPFPVDLSRGVKQFRHRRGTLRRLLVRLDLEALGQHLVAPSAEVLGEPVVGVRVRAAPLTDAPPTGSPGADNDAHSPTLGLVAVSVFGAERAVAFDLVLAPGSPPSFIVDAARGVSLEQPALATVLRLIDHGLTAAPLGMSRKGRSIELSGLARALLAEIFPSLGFRTPRIGGHVVHRAVFGPEGISLSISADDDVCPVGARAVRLAGLAMFTRKADDHLAHFELDAARTELLDVLERVPGHAEVLLNLAEIDAVSPHRSESALAFLEEARPLADRLGSRLPLIAHRALARGLRHDLAVEALEQATLQEADGTLAALCHCAIAARALAPERARDELDRAVGRAPAHPAPRLMRFERSLQDGSLSKALVDAQQLESLAAAGRPRALVTAEIGRQLAKSGHTNEALVWLRRALVSSPDDARILIDLASTLESVGQGLRAAELYQAALARAEGAEIEGELDLDGVRWSLGRLLASETGDLPLALGVLRKVGSRARVAIDARALEVALSVELGDVPAVRSAALRLVQAVELGWIDSERAPQVLAEVEATLRRLGQDDLADHAARAASSVGG